MERNSRILILSEVFWPEDFMVNDLAREWLAMGHRVEVITQYPSYPQSYVFDGYENRGETVEDWDGILIHRFPFIEGYKDSKLRKFANYFSFIRGGKKIAKRIGGNFDAVFVSQTGPLTVALPAVAAGKKYGIPVTIWTLDIWPDVLWNYGVPKWKPVVWFVDRLIKKIYAGCDRICVSSKSFKDTISKYSNKDIVYAPNWLRPVEEVPSALRLDEGKFHFTFTGNISLYQNLANTVLGFGKAGLEDCVLDIVGDGSYMNQLRAVVEENNVTGVVFHGRRPYGEMQDILTQSQVLVLPLIPDEGIMKTEPLKLQSYLHAGRPILGILGGSGKDIIEENGLGVVARPDDVDDIARAFREAVEFYKEHSEEVSARASELMRTRFCKEEIVAMLTDVVLGE